MNIDFEEQQLSNWIEERLVPLGPLVGVPNQELCKKFRDFFVLSRAPKPGQSGYSDFEERVMWTTCKLGKWLAANKKTESGEARLQRNVLVPFLRSLEQRENRAEQSGGNVIPLFGPRRK